MQLRPEYGLEFWIPAYISPACLEDMVGMKRFKHKIMQTSHVIIHDSPTVSINIDYNVLDSACLKPSTSGLLNIPPDWLLNILNTWLQLTPYL